MVIIRILFIALMAASMSTTAQALTMVSPQLTIVNYSSSRLTVTSPHTFDTVMSSLYAEVGNVAKWPTVNLTSVEAFTSSINAIVGPHGFMFFTEFNHGAWVPIFGVGGGLKAKRVIIGNPLIAITMLQYDMHAGLFVPIEILVMEAEGGACTTIEWNLPSSQISGINKDPRLLDAARKLDEKALALVQYLVA